MERIIVSRESSGEIRIVVGSSCKQHSYKGLGCGDFELIEGAELELGLTIDSRLVLNPIKAPVTTVELVVLLDRRSPASYVAFIVTLEALESSARDL